MFGPELFLQNFDKAIMFHPFPGAIPLSTNVFAVINVLSENEFTPDVSANAAMNTVSFDESIPIGSAIYTAVATDLDTSEFGEIRFICFLFGFHPSIKALVFIAQIMDDQ